ncbi:hypothetical protein FRAHR75_970006 [Frankia sp. Hr75.2]|nr:hypothetical protein FRAHR75_970006 [Frankia sp. Hr75.2]
MSNSPSERCGDVLKTLHPPPTSYPLAGAGLPLPTTADALTGRPLNPGRLRPRQPPLARPRVGSFLPPVEVWAGPGSGDRCVLAGQGEEGEDQRGGAEGGADPESCVHAVDEGSAGGPQQILRATLVGPR